MLGRLLAPWRRLEAAVATRLYRLGLLCATRPVLVLYACMLVIIALSYPAAVYLDRAINGPAGHEPLRFWQPAYRLSAAAAPPPPDAFAGTQAALLPQPLLQIRQVYTSLADAPPLLLDNETAFQLPKQQQQHSFRGRRQGAGPGPGLGDGGSTAGTDGAVPPPPPLPLEAYPHGVLERHLLARLSRLQRVLEAFRAADNTTLATVCFRVPGAPDAPCLINSPLGFWNNSETALRADPNVRATLSLLPPAHAASDAAAHAAGLPLSLHSVFGGVVVDDATGQLTYASSMVVTYFTATRLRSERDRADAFWSEVWRSDAVRALGHLLAVTDEPDLDGEGHRYFVFRPESGAAAQQAPQRRHPLQRAPSAEVWLLGVAYLVMFLYISLSLGRVELVKSKFGLGLSAVVTVVFALLMSVGICNLLGTPLTLLPWEILPFLLMFIGVENTFTITNAVTSTSIDLPVKERIAIGLATAGPPMVRSLLAELIVMLAGTATSILALRQFCVFALVAVIVDFVLQISFFVTVLSIDIRRLELVDLHDSRVLSMLGQSAASTPLATSPPGSPTPAPVSSNDALTGDSGAQAPTLAMPARRTAAKPSVLTAALLCLLAGVLILGFSSTTLGPLGGHLAMHGLAWDDSKLVATDDFWTLVNPNGEELMVEVLPPVHVELWPRWPGSRAEPPSGNMSHAGTAPELVLGSDMGNAGSGSGTAELLDPERTPEEAWQLMLDRMRMEWIEWGSRSSSYWVVMTRWLTAWSPALMDYLFRAGPLLVIFVTATLTALVVSSTILFFVIWPTWRTSFRRRHAAALAPEWTQGPVREVHLVRQSDDVECFDGGGDDGGPHVVTAGLDRAVRVWEVATGECIHTFGSLPSPIWQLRMADGLAIAGCASGHIVVFSIEDRCVRYTLPRPPATPSSAAAHPGGVTCMAVDSERRHLFTGGNDRTVKGWALDTGELMFTLAEHQSALTRLTFHARLGLLISGTRDGTVRVFKGPIVASSGRQPSASPDTADMPALDHGTAAASSTALAPPPLCRWTLHGHVNAITSLLVADPLPPSLHPGAGTADDDATDAGDAGGTRPGSGDRAHHARRRHAPGNTAPAVAAIKAAAAAALAPLRLVTASQDGQIRVWDISDRSTGACVATLAYHTKAVTTLAYDADCNVLASAGQDERVVLWDASAYRRIYRKYTPGATALALRDSVLVVGQVAAGSGPPATSASSTSASGAVRAAEHAFAPPWADAHAGLSLLDVRTRTVLRRSLPLQRTGLLGDNMVDRLAFAGDTLLVGTGDSLTLVRLSRSHAVKRD